MKMLSLDPFSLSLRLFKIILRLILKLFCLLFVDFTRWVLSTLARKLYGLEDFSRIPRYYRIPIFLLGMGGSICWWAIVSLFFPQAPGLQDDLFSQGMAFFFGVVTCYSLSVCLIHCYVHGIVNTVRFIAEPFRRLFLVGVNLIRVLTGRTA